MPLHDSDDGVAVAEITTPPGDEIPLAPSEPLADLEHPWLGLESFREETCAYFFGRDAEISELHLRLRSDPLLVLYGRSGLGKTSILLAGLIPRLRAQGQRPLLLRLWYGESAQDVSGQLVSAVFGWGDRQSGPIALKPMPTKSLLWTQCLGEKLSLSLPDDLASRLWLRLHYRDEPPDITHLILDQFEEVFTLGARDPGAEEKVRDILAILLQGAVPESIGRLIGEHDGFNDHFDLDSVPVRVILALRSDYVYALNRWRRHLPALGQNSFELRPLRGPGAFDAVFKPGELRCHYRGEVSEENKVETGLPSIITERTAQHVVRFVAQKGEEVPIEEIEAVPPILSLLCRELNERRFIEPGGTPENPAPQITFRESEADIETIIAAFYDRCLANRPEAVGTFIEEELVSYSGTRLAQDEKSILRVFTEGCEIPGAAEEPHADGFGNAVAARACLEDLVNQRLLSSLGGGENLSYELVHDLLATVVERRRAARKERLEKEAAYRRAEAERKAKDEAEASAREAADRAAVLDAALKKETQARRAADLATRRAGWLAVTASVIAILAAIAFINALRAREEKERQRVEAEIQKIAAEEARNIAQQAKERAVASKKAADELIRFMHEDLWDRLWRLGHLNIMEEISARIMTYQEEHPPEPGQRVVALNRQGDILLEKGELSEALKIYQHSLEIAKRLARQDPANARRQRDLSYSCYIRVGDVLQNLGDLTGALKSYRDSLGIAEKLAKQDPANARRQRDLSYSYISVGNVLKAQGELADALESCHDSLRIVEKLAEQDPGNVGLQGHVYVRVGEVLQAQGELESALKRYRESLGIRERLAKQDPANARRQREVAQSHIRIGEVLQAQGDLEGAFKSYRDSLEICEKLVNQDAANAFWQRDLSYCYINVGIVSEAQGDLAGALKNYRNSLEIREKLDNQQLWQRDLSYSDINFGIALEVKGDLAGALKIYRDSLGIREEPANQDPVNAGKEPPNTLGTIPFGIHRLTANLDRYEPIYQELQINTTIPVSKILEWKRILAAPAVVAGDLTVESDPPGATITLDEGTPLKAPHTFRNVSFGGHRLTATQEGYLPTQRDLEFSAATSSPLVVKLEQKPPPPEQFGNLSVLSNPLGASILLDGRPPNEPPNTFTQIPFGKHRLTATLDGYEAIYQELQIDSTNNVSKILELKRTQQWLRLQELVEQVNKHRNAPHSPEYVMACVRYLRHLYLTQSPPAPELPPEELKQDLERIIEGLRTRQAVMKPSLSAQEFQKYKEAITYAAKLDILQATLMLAENEREQHKKFSLFENAATQKNDPWAMMMLGILYAKGAGDISGKPDYDKALDWLQRAAKAGNKEAAAYYNEAYLFVDTRTPRSEGEQESAIESLRELAQQGVPHAKVVLGEWCRRKAIAAKDKASRLKLYREAADWWKKAKGPREWRACYYLGVLYEKGSLNEDGKPTENDLNEAKALYQEGADNEDIVCMFQLGRFMWEHSNDWGNSGQRKRALSLIRDAAAAGSEAAKAWLATNEKGQ